MYYLSVPRGVGLLDQQPKEEAQGPCLRRPSQKRLAGGSSLTSTKYAPFPLVPPVQELSALSQLMTEPAKGACQAFLPRRYWLAALHHLCPLKPASQSYSAIWRGLSHWRVVV